MNIKEAKDQIKNAITAYFTRDEFNNFQIPIERQRPIFLMGAPGIGKTAIMEQIAQELGVGLVSYSMTHHTRQSAIGLPFIVKKSYGGKEYDVSEYTMSEIIASVYDMMEQTGIKEGILFLDEINCVSETLAPAMLQFLQYKIFGRHRVPEGWIVVTAGNPPEFNKSVREFDIVTWDRLKRVDVEADYEAWKEYAYRKGVHPVVMTYLEIKKGDFYLIETTVDGKSFVTARGWDDLAQMIYLYEQHKITVDEKLTIQYLQNPKIAKDFAIYYDLFNKYKADYQIDTILAGKVSNEIVQRAKAAKFDERLSLLGLLLDAITHELRTVMEDEQVVNEQLTLLKKALVEITAANSQPAAVMEKYIDAQQQALANGKRAGSISAESQRVMTKVIDALQKQRVLLVTANPAPTGDAAFKLLKKDFDASVADLKKGAETAGKKLSNVFQFAEKTFGDGQELLILVTELTMHYHAAKFISRYGSKEYFNHNKELLFYERQKDIISQLERLELTME
jgi:hypothetical protein